MEEPIEAEVAEKAPEPPTEDFAPPVPAHQAPLDIPREHFSAALARRGANYEELIAWVGKDLKESIDFGRIVTGGRLSKPSLWKSGAEKICGRLSLVAEFPDQEMIVAQIVQGKIKDDSIIAQRCWLHLHDIEGPVVSQGMGSYEVTQHYRSGDVIDVNKAIKMSEKRAYIDAVLRCAGLSAVFTQDLEEANGGAVEEGKIDPAERMPMGPYQGVEYEKLPNDYLQEAVKTLAPGLPRKKCEEELQLRKDGHRQDVT